MRTFGDSTKTPGEFVTDKSYILAQLPEDSNVDWARDLRAQLGGAELKFKEYLELRHKIQAKTQLWKRVLEGTAAATVVVIENNFYIQAMYLALTEEGAELGEDYGIDELLRKAARLMVEWSPALKIPDPLEETVPYLDRSSVFRSPDNILKRIGGEFRDAVVFAARSEAATCDEEPTRSIWTPVYSLTSSYRRRILARSRSVERVFDEEHKASADVLNELLTGADMYDVLSDNTASYLRTPLVTEASSHSSDFLQGADFCAGFASEIMMNAANDRERAVRQHFRRVIYNGSSK